MAPVGCTYSLECHLHCRETWQSSISMTRLQISLSDIYKSGVSSPSLHARTLACRIKGKLRLWNLQNQEFLGWFPALDLRNCCMETLVFAVPPH